VKKGIIWLALVVVGIVVALFFGRSRVETGSTNRPWPLGLGNVSDAPKRFPATKDNEAANKLIELARKAQIDLRAGGDGRGRVREDHREAFLEYLREQMARTGEAIDAPPSDVERYLADHAAPLDEIRTLALSGEPIVFESKLERIARDPSNGLEQDPRDRDRHGPNLRAMQQLHFVFVTRALVAARAGNAEAWDELRAAWVLIGPLWNRPDVTAVLTASTGARLVNTAARWLPMPPAPWFQEVVTFPYERALVASQQADTWRSETPGALSARLRGTAEEVLRVKACDAASPQFDAVREKLGARATPSLVDDWQRLMRFRAEREATQRVFHIRSGQMPARQSQCSDGEWKVTATSIEFTREVKESRRQLQYALEYVKKP
jgi:hypothetical protein